MKLRPIDATGKRIRAGDTVRVVGVPDKPVFQSVSFTP
jgi:hypothetical protein